MIRQKKEIELNQHPSKKHSEKPGQIVSPLHETARPVWRTPDKELDNLGGNIRSIAPLNSEFVAEIPEIRNETDLDPREDHPKS